MKIEGVVKRTGIVQRKQVIRWWDKLLREGRGGRESECGQLKRRRRRSGG